MPSEERRSLLDHPEYNRMVGRRRKPMLTDRQRQTEMMHRMLRNAQQSPMGPTVAGLLAEQMRHHVPFTDTTTVISDTHASTMMMPGMPPPPTKMDGTADANGQYTIAHYPPPPKVDRADQILLFPDMERELETGTLTPDEVNSAITDAITRASVTRPPRRKSWWERLLDKLPRVRWE